MATTNTPKLRRITPAVGAVVDDVDLRRSLAPEVVRFILQALLDHGVIFLRDQDISVDQFWAFLKNFGTPLKDETTGTAEDTPDKVATADYSRSRHATAVWHADTTSLAKPPWGTALRAVKPTPIGGDTCWSSMYAAYEALSQPMRRLLDGLTAVHSVQPTYDRMKEYAPSFEAQYAPRHKSEQVHPVVTTHPETGRKALYVNESFTTQIVEMTPAESAAVLSMLFRHVEKPDFTMRWKWSANDIAFWDNRSVQHYAVPDYDSARIMQRISLAGDRPYGPQST